MRQQVFAVAMLASMAFAADSNDAALFKSGSVSTYDKFNYGKFVTRMKAPNKKGTVSSFFTYWDGPDFTPTEWNEMDIEIVPSVSHNPFSMNIIYGDGHDKQESHRYAHGFDPAEDWHTYAIEWTPEYISWYVDGREVRQVNVDDPAVDFLNKEQSLRMNFWTPTFDSWGKGLDAKDMPWFLLYDYVEVFTYDEDENEFNLLWRDDFDSFDEKRWHKASGGFDANSSVFHPDNVSVKAGHLVLKMEPLPETKSKPTKVAEPVIVHHDTPYIHQHVDRHFGDRIEPPNRRHHREDLRAESFDRDMARAYRSPHHDSKFWMNKEDRREMSRNDEKQDYSEENDDATSSDSDQDWLEYQDYLHSHHEKGEHFVPHHQKTVVVPHHEEVVHEEFHPEVGHHYHETVTYGKPVHHEVIPVEHHVVPVEHHVVHRHVYDSDTDSDVDSEDDYLAHDDYLRYKYDHEHEARSHDALTKQQEADLRYAKFRREHPYMGEDELELYHEKFEVEPFFHTHEEKDAWRAKKKEEKMLREQQRAIMKHQREMKEIQEAYDLILDPTYHGDKDIDHVIEQMRKRFDTHRHHVTVDEYYPEPVVTHHTTHHVVHEEPIVATPVHHYEDTYTTYHAHSEPVHYVEEKRVYPDTPEQPEPATHKPTQTKYEQEDKQVEKADDDWADYQAYLASHKKAQKEKKDKKTATAAAEKTKAASEPRKEHPVEEHRDSIESDGWYGAPHHYSYDGAEHMVDPYYAAPVPQHYYEEPVHHMYEDPYGYPYPGYYHLLQ